MNTPAHAVAGLLLLSPEPSHRRSSAIVAGALLPDLAIILHGLAPCVIEALGGDDHRGLPALQRLRAGGLELDRRDYSDR